MLTDSGYTDLNFSEPNFGEIFVIGASAKINFNYLDYMLNVTTQTNTTILFDQIIHSLGICMGIGKLTFSHSYVKNKPVSAYIDEQDGNEKFYYYGENALREYKSYFPTLDVDKLVGIPLEDYTGYNGKYIDEGDATVIASTNDRLINGYIHPALVMRL